ncbi:MAG: hypothetical protein KZQ78_11580 [Candidatus Thiodiazotropha sp. (ex Ustalcina ferruginea)]|nr:hypothetical protein [Candidatus Thiodiazotropha sp. (ex Ustalcina ferruginea)]
MSMISIIEPDQEYNLATEIHSEVESVFGLRHNPMTLHSTSPKRQEGI